MMLDLVSSSPCDVIGSKNVYEIIHFCVKWGVKHNLVVSCEINLQLMSYDGRS